jgi:drug/metabolite transporter (DMT)-like permease
VYNALLFAHLVGVVLLSSAIAMEVVTVVRLLRAREVATIRSALATLKVLEVLPPAASVIVIGFGLSMVARGGDHPSGTPKEFSFGAGWLVTVYIVYAIMLAIGPGVNGRRLTHISEVADAAADGPVTAELATLRRDPVLAFTASLAPCAILLALFLMTNKPKGAANVAASGVALVLTVVLWALWQRAAAGTAPSTAHATSAAEPVTEASTS